MDFLLDSLFILTSLFSLTWGLWLVRINRWPKVRVNVIKTWEEVTGKESSWSTGWLHAELEYTYRKKHYSVLWRGDLTSHRYLPRSCKMVIDPRHADQPQLPASWKLPFVLIAVALLLSLNVFLRVTAGT